MRLKIVSALAGAALALSVLPAAAAWHGYISREAGFSFHAPGEVKTEKANYTSAMAGQRAATMFQSAEDNIEYKVMVVDFTGGGFEDAALIKEASTAFLGENKVLADVEARVEGTGGRKMAVELSGNGGRSMASIYFKNGRLIELIVTVLPANGDYGTPDTGRFVELVAFGDERAEPDATELKLAN